MALTRWQEGVELRRVIYHEAILRDAVLKTPGWDGRLGVSARRKLDDIGQVVTVCDALPRSYRHLPQDVSALRKRPLQPLERDVLFSGLARLELAVRNPGRAPELFPWGADAIDGYWERIASENLTHLEVMKDTADFHANYLLRLLYLHGQTPPHLRHNAPWRLPGQLDRSPWFSAVLQSKVRAALLGFKYWLDEPFHAMDSDSLQRARTQRLGQSGDDAKYEMTFWSENHQVLFATAELLAGQLFLEDEFLAGRPYRNGGDRSGAMVGEERVRRAALRLRRWLSERLRFGFSEWNAPGYYGEDVTALCNLVDFCLDPELQEMASMVFDLLVFDLARFTHAGSFGTTAGRAYFEQKSCGWEQAVGEVIELLFGTRGAVSSTSEAGGAVASMRRYDFPSALLAIGEDKPTELVDRTRVSISFEEAGGLGIGFERDDDLVAWWGRMAYFAKQTVEATVDAAKRWGLMKTDPFGKLDKVFETGGTALATFDPIGLTKGSPLSFPDLASLAGPLSGSSRESQVADAMSVFVEGSVLSRANLYCYRNRDAMLSSVQRYRPGQLNFQALHCQATLSMGANVWTTHPSAGGGIDSGVASTLTGIAGGATAGGLVAGPLGAIGGAIAGGIWGANQDKGIQLFPATHDGPNWWTGSVTNPFVAQQGSAAIAMYNPNAIQLLLFGHRTHAWFPRERFDDEGGKPAHAPVTSRRCNVDSGRWVFGKVGSGYLALFSGQTPVWTEDGDWKGKELIADGKRNVFIFQVGSAEQHGSYDEFREAVLNARIHVNGLHWAPADFECSYDIPSGKRLEVHYDEGARYDGHPMATDEFPRFDNPYITCGQVDWGEYAYTIAHAGHTLTHDFRALGEGAERRPIRRSVDRDRVDCSVVHKLQVRVRTADEFRAGTDNDVYFDIGPLGWRLASDDNDFEQGDDHIYDLPLPDVEVRKEDIVWLRLHKKGLFGVDGTGGGIDGDWKPSSIELLVNGRTFAGSDVGVWLDGSRSTWIHCLRSGSAGELFARTLRLVPNKALDKFSEDIAFITTPWFKQMGISGWNALVDLPEATATGEVIRPPGESTDAFATIDLRVDSVQAGGATFYLDGNHGINGVRYLRVEYRFRKPFPLASGEQLIPRQGQLCRIAGAVRWDTDKEGWYEIHPRGPTDVEIFNP